MRDPALLAIHVRATAEILSRPDALVDEMRLIANPWGTDFTAVTTPAAIWVGAGDTTHPPVMAHRLAALLGGDVAVTVVPDAGTFGVASHYPDALRFATP
jgi:pimeloyl-ACP methyl ester carboxylesterase